MAKQNAGFVPTLERKAEVNFIFLLRSKIQKTKK